MFRKEFRIGILAVVIVMLMAFAFSADSAEAKTTVTIWTAFPQLHEFTVAVG